MKSGFFIWQTPDKIERSWHPQFYSPEFLYWDESIELHPEHYKKLGDLVKVVPSQKYTPDWGKNIKWAALHFGIREVEGLSNLDQYFSDKRGIIFLPPEAIIIDRLISRELKFSYWNEDLFQGSGASSPVNSSVLQPSGEDPIAWLYQELKTDLVKSQIRRLAIGSVIALLNTKDLLNIKIKIPVGEEKLHANQKTIELARSQIAIDIASHRISKEKDKTPTFIITGATFEERQTQFEKYLLNLPSINPDCAFYIESSTPDKISDLFMVRSLRGGKKLADSKKALELHPVENKKLNKIWRDWYQDISSHQKYRIFNTLSSSYELPTFLMARMASHLLDKQHKSIFYDGVLPPFEFYRSIAEKYLYQPIPNVESFNLELIVSWMKNRNSTIHSKNKKLQLPVYSNLKDKAWHGRNSSIGYFEPKYEYSIVHLIYQPFLCLKMIRDYKVVGIYFLTTKKAAHTESFERVDTILQGLGSRLCEALEQASTVLDEAARNESLRRLSTVMHQINGPLMRINRVVEDIRQFLDEHSEIASMLLPNEKMAKSRAKMLNSPIETMTFKPRFGVLAHAANSIKKLGYRIRELRLVQGEMDFFKTDLREIIQRAVNSAKEQMVNLHINLFIEKTPIFCNLNSDSISNAIEEVINNAIREIREHNVSNPEISISLVKSEKDAIVEILDNALPAEKDLISHPFEEGATQYGRSGRGSGLGLTVVYETFRKHGGSCSLSENMNSEDIREPGVKFRAVIPLI